MKKLTSFLLLSFILISFTQCKKDKTDECDKNTCSHTLTSGQTAGTVPASTVGLHSLTLQYAVATSPYPNGTTAEFDITADNKLVVKLDGKCVTLTNPYQTSPSEVVFTDNCVFNMKFAVSEKNTGGLNEVNIGDLGTTFYGQFH